MVFLQTFLGDTETRQAAGDGLFIVLIHGDLAMRLDDGVVGGDFVRKELDLILPWHCHLGPPHFQNPRNARGML